MISENIIILVSATLLLSYISSLIYSKTKVPDIIWLMGFGIVVGPILDFFDKELFLTLAPMMSVIALSIILFEAGINVDIETILQVMGKSAILSITSILSSVIIVGVFINYFLPADFPLLQGMLLGAMIGGTSTISTYGVLSGLSKSVKNLTSTRILLTVESVVSSPISIITSITLIKMIMLPNVTLTASFQKILVIFELATLLGLSLGLIWALILDKLRDRPFLYMITLAILFPSFIISESMIGRGGGAMTALAFGLGISNFKYLMEKLGGRTRVRINLRRLRGFHEEITFFIKSFFFVYIGLIVSLSLKNSIIGLIIVILLMAIRYIIVKGLSPSLRFSREEKIFSQVIYASGLPAFVTSQLPMIFDPTGQYFVNTGIYPNLCMPIVLGTVIYSSIFGQLVGRKLRNPETAPDNKGEDNPN
jgi:cell volume regulation protein A